MTNELIRQQSQQLTINDQMALAKNIANAAILPDAYRGKPADVLVAMGLGASMGLSPMESLYRINVIKGKPTASAELIAAQVRRAGHKLRIKKDEQHLSVTATIIRNDDPDAPFSVTRDQKWAEQMGLAGKDNYRKQPLTMLTWRAVTAVAREACPESLYGIAYTPDEMHDMDRMPASRTAKDDPNIEVTGVEETPAQPTASAADDTATAGSAPEVLCSSEQANKINDLLRQGGVNSSAKAYAAFHALCGREINTAAKLGVVDAENLLSAPELVVSRTREAIKELETQS